MPKVDRPKRSKVSIYLEEFPNETLRSDGQVLYCQSCDKSASIDQRGQVIQHINTSKHRGNKDRKLIFQQNFISTSSASTNSKSVFNDDLCRALIRLDIPLFKLKNVAFKNFMEKYTGHTIPDESTLRKNYVSGVYEETISKIQNIIGDGPIWVGVDETTDADGRYIANVIVGKLSTEPSKPFLLCCEELDKCNHKTICQLFNNAMGVLWSNDPEAAMAIKKTVELIDSKNLQNNLSFISTNFGFLVDTISKLETSKMPLTESLEIVDNAIKQLERVPGEIGVLTNSKLKNVLEKNTGFNTVMSIRDILLNKTPNNNYSEIEYTRKEIMCMKYAPVHVR
ncbi:hypothetical protein QTP88_010886 [Uroleucon formosanum]